MGVAGAVASNPQDSATIAVNPVDTKVRKRRDPAATEPAVLGWDAAGVVEAVGAEVTGFAAGDEVWYAGSNVRPASATTAIACSATIARLAMALTREAARASPT